MGMVFGGWTAAIMQKIMFFSSKPLFFRFVSELPSNFAHVKKKQDELITLKQNTQK